MKRFLFVLLTCVSPAAAWEDHQLMTSLSLEKISGLDAAVPVETVQAFTASQWFSSEKEFLERLKLNPQTQLEFKAGEIPGERISIRKILETYSDEPDWQMDHSIFSSYPELWKGEYDKMGGDRGPGGSKGVRHFYWPYGGLSINFISGSGPLGEAPERAQLFFDESRAAFQSGHPYWGARLLAWSLHYIQDASQPYHAVQLPAFAMLRWKSFGRVDVDLTARLVAYYHDCFEAYTKRLLSGGSPDALGLRQALSGLSQAVASTDARTLTREMALKASEKAKEAAQISIQLFPAKDLDDFDLKNLPPTPAKYIVMVTPLLEILGRATRAAVSAALELPAPKVSQFFKVGFPELLQKHQKAFENL